MTIGCFIFQNSSTPVMNFPVVDGDLLFTRRELELALKRILCCIEWTSEALLTYCCWGMC